MNAEQRVRRPVLVSHAKYRWDDLREEHQIVYPEGVLVLNESAAGIVRLCDGRSTDDVIASLRGEIADDSNIVSDQTLESDVQVFLSRLVDKGLLCDAGE